MATPPNSYPPESAPSPSMSKRTRKATQLISLSAKPVGVERPIAHVDPTTWKVDGPHKKKLRTYLGVIARDKVDVTYVN